MSGAQAFTLSFVSKVDFRPIGTVPFAVWTYRLEWSKSNPLARVGIVLSSRIDIRDPADFPELAAIQDCRVAPFQEDGAQVVYRDLVSPSGSVDLAFLATSAEDSFTAMQLFNAIPEAGPWKELSYTTPDDAIAGRMHALRGPEATGLAPSAPASAPRLTNSSRRVPKSTLVSFQLPPVDDQFGGRAVLKFSFARQLGLQAGEVDAVDASVSAQTKALLQRFEGAPIPALLPSPSAFTNISPSELRAFGSALVNLRSRAASSQSSDGPGQEIRSAKASLGHATATSVSNAVNQLNAAVVANNWFESNFQVTPIGMLNLERIEMTPVGVERGALLATIPLAPLEETAVVHKEWSVTTKEFTSIVTDSLENYSETGVTENTELAQSTQSQTAHSNQFNVNGTVTGSYGPVTATVTSSFTSQNQDSDSATESRKHAVTTTRKASSRVKQEHKVTISTTTVTGTSESSTRILKNPSSTDAMRIDYFSIMRKWHVGLYRYGLRLTYDIAIPEPGAGIRQVYADIDSLQAKIGPFKFDITHDTIATSSYSDLQKMADRFGAVLPPPLEAAAPLAPKDTPPAGDGWHFAKLSFDVPPDYQVDNIHLYTDVGAISRGNDHPNPRVVVETTRPLFAADYPDDTGGGGSTGGNRAFDADLRKDGQSLLAGATGHQDVVFNLIDAGPVFVGLEVTLAPTDAKVQQWRNEVWNALFNAAQTQHYAQQQEYANEVAALQAKINGVDTLTLRREENEEIMKGVLRWLLGPSFDFMPADVQQQFIDQKLDTLHGTAFDQQIGDGLNVTAAGWYPMFMYQEMVKFINEAIEWENVLYFLYAYFWDIPQAWRFVRQLQHPDATRQAFLRAGSARVVLTVRKGWELAWVNFVEAGGFGQVLLPNHPYLSIANEIQAYDDTNYPGIPSANPGGGPLPDDGACVSTQCHDALAASGSPVTIRVESSDGFRIGYTAVVDDYSSGTMVGGAFVTSQEKQTIVAVPDATHITVAQLQNAHTGVDKAFPVLQAGEKGQLIAEWFEYTPTSGTDIAITSELATVS